MSAFGISRNLEFGTPPDPSPGPKTPSSAPRESGAELDFADMETNGNALFPGKAPEGATQRLELLFGKEGLERISRAKVLVVGVGGVGSWCAESLVRSGVRRVALMDDDVVVPSNLNRQLEATSKTVGLPKVEAMADRLREISLSPDGSVTTLLRTQIRRRVSFEKPVRFASS